MSAAHGSQDDRTRGPPWGEDRDSRRDIFSCWGFCLISAAIQYKTERPEVETPVPKNSQTPQRGIANLPAYSSSACVLCLPPPAPSLPTQTVGEGHLNNNLRLEGLLREGFKSSSYSFYSTAPSHRLFASHHREVTRGFITKKCGQLLPPRAK